MLPEQTKGKACLSVLLAPRSGLPIKAPVLPHRIRSVNHLQTPMLMPLWSLFTEPDFIYGQVREDMVLDTEPRQGQDLTGQ